MASLLRKRSATETEPEREPYLSRSPPTSPSHPHFTSTFGDTLKRNRSNNELESTRLIPSADAWVIDMSSIASGWRTAAAQNEQAHGVLSNVRNFAPGRSMWVLCVLSGNMSVHHDMLCNNLASLYGLSPTIQVLSLSRSPTPTSPSTPATTQDLTRASFSSEEEGGGGVREETVSPLPMLNAIGPSPQHNMFGKLGLLHPLGGGQEALDAIVVIDALGRKRLVLPVGWGAGRYVTDGAGGRMVQDRLMRALLKGIKELEAERAL